VHIRPLSLKMIFTSYFYSYIFIRALATPKQSCAFATFAYGLATTRNQQIYDHFDSKIYPLTRCSRLNNDKYTTGNCHENDYTEPRREEKIGRELLLHASTGRRGFAMNSVLAACTSFLSPDVCVALVKGNAPPPKKSSEENAKPKCRNVEECQDQAERLAAQQQEQEISQATPLIKAPGGTRYKVISEGVGGTSRTVSSGDRVRIYFKVLKLGKRSYDGVSGEGTVIFSKGYGLEDDEAVDKPLQDPSKSFEFVVGDMKIIDSLNDAILGMSVGDVRRISLLPERAWRKPGLSCEGGPGGRGTGGELRTDYIVVPTATMVQEEICLDSGKKPYPQTYAQQRRMAQRFDQSLIIEVQLVSID